MDQVSGCQVEIQGFTSNEKRAQRKLELMIDNLRHRKDHPHHSQEAEHEILNEMDEAKKRFDEELAAMGQQERLHGDALNEFIELSYFQYTYGQENWEEQKKEAKGGQGGETRGCTTTPR